MTNVTPPPSEPPVGGTPPQGATPAGQPYGQPQGAPQGQPYGQPQGAPQGQPYGQPQGQQYGTTPPPYSAPAGGGAPVKQTLSLTSFIVGLAAVVILSWIPVLGLLAGVAAVIIGFMGKNREPQAPKWMWLVGVIAGFVAILINIIATIAIVLPFLILGSTLSTY